MFSQFTIGLTVSRRIVEDGYFCLRSAWGETCMQDVVRSAKEVLCPDAVLWTCGSM